MKKYVIVIIIASAIFTSCKKDKAAEVAGKDYSASIKDKTWWGELANAGEKSQNYSVQFSAGNILVWSQLSGDYTGTWAVDKNKLTLSFTNPVVKVTADITDDNKLINIITSTANKVNSGELVPNPNIVLENTVWKGSSNITAHSFQINFTPGLILTEKIDIDSHGPYSYIRGASGGYIRFKERGINNSFGVITTTGEMKGSILNVNYFWNLTKQ